MVNTIERRFNAELRLSNDGKKIVGYAAVYDKSSEDLGGFIEYVRPGAFDRSLKTLPDVRALINHDSTLILGRTLSGTLLLGSDSTGLEVNISPPDTSYAKDLMVSMARGDITQMSFAFTTAKDDWQLVEGQRTRSLLDLDLVDVSVVTYPAYTDTSVAVRSLQDWNKISRREQFERRARALRLHKQK